MQVQWWCPAGGPRKIGDAEDARESEEEGGHTHGAWTMGERHVNVPTVAASGTPLCTHQSVYLCDTTGRHATW